ncbi:molybdate ABC transporter permease subunit [Cerasicoccus maritimus]|uniref:molybdate ABC transporter permease subunit n=1 Tax=Cerasicoccus maritimus TaxID=490089 RepID=UPI0028525B85|nr:molybdate ABC transporter permease subunit [Cerasicoccus maritimus]
MEPIINVILSTLAWASLASLIVFLLGTPLAYWMARYDFIGKRALIAISSLPLVLPPTAVGYLLLLLLADRGLLGRETLGFSLDILLTWKGVVLAYCVMSFPLYLRTARVSFEAVDPGLESINRTLGNSRLATFFAVTLPLAKRGLAAGIILSFTRAMGEFGATIMVAANIPGKTQTLASAIYSAQQSGDDTRANILLMVAIALGFILVYLTEWLAQPKRFTNSHASNYATVHPH